MLAVNVLYPFFFLVSAALKPYRDYIRNPYGWPTHLTCENFQSVINFGIGAGFTNSVELVVSTVALILVVASLAGYAFATMRFRGRDVLQWVMLSLLYVPGMDILLPLISMIASLGLLDQRWVVILLYTAISQPFGTYFRANYLKSLPTEIYDAARIDRASSLGIYWHIVLPLARPAPATIGALEFLSYLLFFEEPVPSDSNEMLARVGQAVKIPLTTGERYYTRWGVWPLLKDNLVDIIQTDICHAGGILELRKIAVMAEPFGVTMAPHNPNGLVSLAADVQFAACTPSFLVTESVHTRTLADELVRGAPRIEAGYIPLPTKPGLGIELDEAILATHPGDPKAIWLP